MAQVKPGAIRAISLVDQVTSQLREHIIDGTVPPGRSISITRVAEEMGVSHIPVREALRQLENEGLIALRPGHGATVTPLRAEDVRSIYRIRRWIEPELAALSCPLVTKEDIAQIKDRLEVLREGPISEDIPAHKSFHFMLLRPAASEWDLRILEYLWNANERYARLIFQPSSTADREHLGSAHTALWSAVRSRKPDRVRNSVLEHLNENEAILLDALVPFEAARAAD
jgi:DNA-binding GntR family transcriptional regulator